MFLIHASCVVNVGINLSDIIKVPVSMFRTESKNIDWYEGVISINRRPGPSK